MKKLIRFLEQKSFLGFMLTTLFLANIASASVFTDIGGWYNENPDKIAHGLLGATTAGYALKHLATPETAILDSGIVGIAKECFDKGIQNKQWDIWDAVATLIGGVLLVAL